MKTPDYNKIAGIYEEMARIILRGRQENAREVFMEHIKNGNRVLIVGGGRGTVLSHLQNLNKSLIIDFVDCSSRMIELASQIEVPRLNVNFYTTDINSLTGKYYDIIICQFFFDQFSTESVLKMAKHLQGMLKPDGFLINTDFARDVSMSAMLRNRLMMWFFRLVAGTESRDLPAYEELLSSVGFIKDDAIDLKGAIRAELYKKFSLVESPK